MRNSDEMQLADVSDAIERFAKEHGLTREEVVNLALRNWTVSHDLMQAASTPDENATEV